MYKERNDQYKVLSNRIRTRASMPERKYIDKNNIKILEKYFDPLRVRLRVMPIARAPMTIGKNSEYYFIEAGKLSLRGDLPKALELLKRGLEIKPNHYLCRFNHGVVLFKLGLILEATSDFLQLIEANASDPVVAYNLAVCQVQLGEYGKAVTSCNITIEHGKQDKTLLYDTYKLKGICSFRLGNVQDSIRNYNFANLIAQERQQELAKIDSIEEIEA
jgi:tetratricopeptide (TPR) repeat protein